MNPPVNVTLRFTFVALSVLAGALAGALLLMWATNAIYVAANGQPAAPDAGLFALLSLACVFGGPIGGSLALLGALAVLYVLNMRGQRDRQVA